MAGSVLVKGSLKDRVGSGFVTLCCLSCGVQLKLTTTIGSREFQLHVTETAKADLFLQVTSHTSQIPASHRKAACSYLEYTVPY